MTFRTVAAVAVAAAFSSTTAALQTASVPAAAVAIGVPSAPPVLVDARCEDGEWSAASRTPAGQTMLLVQQDARTVYLCVPLPPDSYGTVDVYVLPDGAAQPVN